VGTVFGADVGYRWKSGLGLDVRGDDLAGGWAAGVGFRYVAVPLWPLRPFAETHLGAESSSTGTAVGVEVGGGLSLLVDTQIAVDLAGRDWIHLDQHTLRNVPAVTLGVEVGF
jgi:hypothetical protein